MTGWVGWRVSGARTGNEGASAEGIWSTVHLHLGMTVVISVAGFIELPCDAIQLTYVPIMCPASHSSGLLPNLESVLPFFSG